VYENEDLPQNIHAKQERDGEAAYGMGYLLFRKPYIFLLSLDASNMGLLFSILSG
jgi:hypothetical protein